MMRTTMMEILEFKNKVMELGLKEEDLDILLEILEAEDEEEASELLHERLTGNMEDDINIFGKYEKMSLILNNVTEYINADSGLSVVDVVDALYVLASNGIDIIKKCESESSAMIAKALQESNLADEKHEAEAEALKSLMEFLITKLDEEENEEENEEECDCELCMYERQSAEKEESKRAENKQLIPELQELHTKRFTFFEMIQALESGFMIIPESVDIEIDVESDNIELEFKSRNGRKTYALINEKLFVCENGKCDTASVSIGMLEGEFMLTEKSVEKIIDYSISLLNENNKVKEETIIAGHEALARIATGEKMNFTVDMFGRTYTGFLALERGIPSYAIDNIEDILGSAEGIILGAIMTGKWTTR